MNSEDISITEKPWSAFTDPDVQAKELFDTLCGGLYGIEYTPLLVSKSRAGDNGYLFVCNANAMARNQRYGAVIKVEQDESGNFQISDIVKIGNPNLANSYSTFEYIDDEYVKDVFIQVQQHFTGVYCEPLLVAKRSVRGSDFLFAVNARLTRGGDKPYPLFVQAHKPLYGEVRLLDVVDAGEWG